MNILFPNAGLLKKEGSNEAKQDALSIHRLLSAPFSCWLVCRGLGGALGLFDLVLDSVHTASVLGLLLALLRLETLLLK